MEELNTLLNKALETKNENYINPNGMKNCLNIFEKKLKKDNITFKLYLYIFPINSSLEKNIEEFWFIKYKIDKKYNEYDFAIDLLKCYIQYLSDKDNKKFESKIIEKIKLFKNYKLIGYFLSVLEKYDDKIRAIISYIIKDPIYFKDNFELNVSPENIQSLPSITDIKRYLEKKSLLLDLHRSLQIIKSYSKELQETKSSNQVLKKQNDNLKKENSDLKNKINKQKEKINKTENENKNLKNQNDNLIKINNDMKDKIKILDEQINNMKLNMEKNKIKINEINEKLEQYYLKKNIKIYFRYLYKVLYSKFSNEMKDQTTFLEQFEEIKNIFNKPQFKRFDFLSKFINDLSFDKLFNFNDDEYNTSKLKLNFEYLKKLMTTDCNNDFTKVYEFFENLPYINEYFNINLMLYLNKNQIDDKFQEIISYPTIYTKIFEETEI